jgi:hypothetical protein
VAVLVALALSLAADACLAQSENNNNNSSNNNNASSNNNNASSNNNNASSNTNESTNANASPTPSPPPPPPPPIINSYGVPVGGKTDDEVKAAVNEFISDFLSKQKPPPGFSFDRFGRLIGSSKETKVTAVQGVGIDGFRDEFEFWLKNGAMQFVVDVLSGKRPSTGGATNPPSTSGPGPTQNSSPATGPEPVPVLSSNSNASASGNSNAR